MGDPDSITPIQLRGLLTVSVSGAVEMDQSLEMEGLREEIGEGKGLEVVSGGEESAEIAGEGGGIAGNVGEMRGSYFGECSCDFGAEAGAGRINNDQIGSLVFGGLAEKVEGRSVDCGAGGVAEILIEGGGCGRSGLDSDDTGEAGGELAREEANAGEEVPGESAFLIVAD